MWHRSWQECRCGVQQTCENAAFDERISLLGLLLDALQEKIRHNVELEDSLRRILPVLKEIKAELAAADDRVDAAAIMEHRADTLQQEMEQEDKAKRCRLLREKAIS